jgi:hypothetical protein
LIDVLPIVNEALEGQEKVFDSLNMEALQVVLHWEVLQVFLSIQALKDFYQKE